jgi:hypothetical protein
MAFIAPTVAWKRLPSASRSGLDSLTTSLLPLDIFTSILSGLGTNSFLHRTLDHRTHAYQVCLPVSTSQYTWDQSAKPMPTETCTIFNALGVKWVSAGCMHLHITPLSLSPTSALGARVLLSGQTPVLDVEPILHYCVSRFPSIVLVTDKSSAQIRNGDASSFPSRLG